MGGSTDVFDGICFSVECKQDRSAHAPAQEHAALCSRVQEALKMVKEVVILKKKSKKKTFLS